MKKKIVILLTFIVMLCSFSVVFANDSGNGDPKSAQANSEEQDNQEDKELRFIKFAEDESFVYLLDRKDSGWIRKPYTADTYVIDAWIKMIPYKFDATDAYIASDEYDNYYLEHYLIDPANKRIQFLCEIEVSGRPENNIKQRKYAPNGWEGLVPESVEDTIYHGVVKEYGKKKGDGTIKQFTDMLEDVFHISIT